MRLEVKQLSDSGNQLVRNFTLEDVILDWGYELTPGRPSPAIKLYTGENNNPYYLIGVHNIETICGTIKTLLTNKAESLTLPIDIFDPVLPTHDPCSWGLKSYLATLNVVHYQNTQAFQIFSTKERQQLILGSIEPIKGRNAKEVSRHWRARLPITQTNISKKIFFDEILANM